MSRPVLPHRRPKRPGQPLTARQLEILTLAGTLTAPEIAAALGIRPSTVRERLHRIYRKLGASDRTGAVVIALKRRLIDLEDIELPPATNRATNIGSAPAQPAQTHANVKRPGHVPPAQASTAPRPQETP